MTPGMRRIASDGHVEYRTHPLVIPAGCTRHSEHPTPCFRTGSVTAGRSIPHCS
jgi:hypothetical protein